MSKEVLVISKDVLLRALLRYEPGKSIIKDSVIVIPSEIMSQIEDRASQGERFSIGAITEVVWLRDLEKEGYISKVSIEHHQSKGLNALAELAEKMKGKVITGDRVITLSLRARGVDVIYIGPEYGEFRLYNFFDESTMSIHLKEGAPPMAKKGRPGEFRLVKLSDNPMEEYEVRTIAYEVLERAKTDPSAFIEVKYGDAYVIQLEDFRILVAFPPFSDGIEITAVRPLVKVTLDDYELSDKLKRRLRERAEGILIAGPPGAGKTTFASALAEFYRAGGKIVKTIESPRDLQVGPEVTQYGRLAGIGMVGVIHCGFPIEAIQRFIGRVDLGVLPHVVDTVIFIKDGRIQKVYSLKITVKMPAGMKDVSLARPVVLVRDFETDSVEYEIYTFGDEVVVMPVRGRGPRHELPEGVEAPIRYRLRKRKHTIILDLGPELAETEVTLYSGNREIATLMTDAKGKITLAKSSPIGRRIVEAVKSDSLRVVPREES